LGCVLGMAETEAVHCGCPRLMHRLPARAFDTIGKKQKGPPK